MTFVFTLIVSFIMWNKTIDYNERENVIKSIEELRESKASKIELRTVEIHAKEYTDKEVTELKRDLNTGVSTLNKRIDDVISNQKQTNDLLRELIKSSK